MAVQLRARRLAGAGAATDSYFLGEAGPEQLNAGWIEISFGERVA